jgi:hypothetical protein
MLELIQSAATGLGMKVSILTTTSGTAALPSAPLAVMQVSSVA